MGLLESLRTVVPTVTHLGGEWSPRAASLRLKHQLEHVHECMQTLQWGRQFLNLHLGNLSR